MFFLNQGPLNKFFRHYVTSNKSKALNSKKLLVFRKLNLRRVPVEFRFLHIVYKLGKNPRLIRKYIMKRRLYKRLLKINQGGFRSLSRFIFGILSRSAVSWSFWSYFKYFYIFYHHSFSIVPFFNVLLLKNIKALSISSSKFSEIFCRTQRRSLFSFSVFTSEFNSNFNIPIMRRSSIYYLASIATLTPRLQLITKVVKTIFNGGIFLTLKVVKNNYFITVVNKRGEVLWKSSSGLVRLGGKDRRSSEALRRILLSLLSFFRNKGIHGMFYLNAFYLSGKNINDYKTILSFLYNHNIIVMYLIADPRTPHGYMRLKKPRRL